MKAILYLQGSLGGRNSRDTVPLFMEPVAGRLLLGLLLDEATASGCFERVVFIASSAACDDPVAEYLEREWPAVAVERLAPDAAHGAAHGFGDGARREQLLTTDDYAGLLSINGFKAIAPPYVRDAAQAVFVLGVNDAPVCSRRFFAAAMPLARETAFVTTIRPGTTALCGFPMRAFETISGHQRSLRVSEAASARDRVERAVQEIRRERYLASDDDIDTVQAWQRARVERYAPYRGGLLSHALRDYVARHVDGARREAFAPETVGEAVAVVSRAGLEMVRTVWSAPSSTDAAAVETWLSDFEQRAFRREAQQRFFPEYPSYLEVEPTSRCNLACRFCPQTKLTRPTSDMPYETFAELIERVGDFVFLLNLSGYGEPTLHPRLFDFVRLAKSKGIPRVGLETNGTTIDDAFLDAAFESGLDVLTINLDAAETIRSGEADAAPFGSVVELVRRVLERRGARQRPFLVLQRVNMAVPGQDKKIQRDFTLWYDVADAFIIKPFNAYRGAFADKRVINFAPLDRTGCKKLLASACVLSSGQAVMCEQCFDGQHAAPIETAWAASVLTGSDPFLRRLVLEQGSGRIGTFCTSCSQWYQQDAAWTAPRTNRAWFERAIAESTAVLVAQVLDRAGPAVSETQIPKVVGRTDDFSPALRSACESLVGRARWSATRPDALSAPECSIGSGDGEGALVNPVACGVCGDRLYVTDAAAGRVRVYSLDGDCERSFGQFGETSTALRNVPDLAVCGDEIVVAERRRLMRFSPGGEALGVGAPEGEQTSIYGIAAGRPGHLWLAADDGRVLLFDLASNELIGSISEPSWLRVFISSSPETNELFVSSADLDEIFIFDLNGTPLRRIGTGDVGRLSLPFAVTRCGPHGYAVSNTLLREVLILSTEFDFIGAFQTSGWPRRLAYGADKLFVVDPTEGVCLVRQFQPVATSVASEA